MLTRRHVLAAAPLLAAPAILRAQSVFTAYPFTLGVASGDPAPDGFVIWTRLAPDPLAEHGGMAMAPVTVQWQVASDEKFGTIVAKGDAIARPELGHSVHVEVSGLQPDRPYWYSFTVGSERSRRGRARTLPAAGAAVDRVRFAVAGCQHFEQGWFTGYRSIAEQEHDFLFHYGDYIYEGRGDPVAFAFGGALLPTVRRHAGQKLFDLADYRRRYAQVTGDLDLQAARAAAPWWATFDDHEVENNWTGSHDQEGDPAEIFLLRRAVAFQAWYEHMPVRAALLPKAGGIAMHRTARYGTLLNAVFLDTRQFRTPQPCGDNFKPYCKEVDSPDAQIIGLDQEKWLDANLSRSSARWNLLAQQVMVMTLDRRTGDEPAPITNMDTWAGYSVPRHRILSKLPRGNTVIVTGDEHQNYTGYALDRDQPVAVEFVSTSISSGGDGSDQRPGSDRILAENPHLKAINDLRGYALCEVTADAWKTRWMTVDKVTDPNARVSQRAEFTVPHGQVAVTQA